MYRFSGVPVYVLKGLHRGAAFTLPGIGIFTGKDYARNIHLLRHEFGHVLQARRYGWLRYYVLTGPLSLWSALREQLSRDHFHKTASVELEANKLSYSYFNDPEDWDHHSFPVTS